MLEKCMVVSLIPTSATHAMNGLPNYMHANLHILFSLSMEFYQWNGAWSAMEMPRLRFEHIPCFFNGPLMRLKISDRVCVLELTFLR